MRRVPTVLLALSLLALAVPARSDVIAYLRFEENGGATAFDETGLLDGELVQFGDTSPGVGDSGIRGWSTSVPSSTVPLTGQTNTGSIRFAGGAEFIDLSNGLDLSMGSTFTIEFYMKPDQPVIGSPIFGFAPNSELYLSLIVDGGSLAWYPQFQSEQDLAPADLVTTGEWQHVALVLQPSEYSIYVDGLLQYNGSIPTGGEGPYFFPGTDITGDRTIGGESGTWRGYIDEFRISDEALTPDQFLIAVPEPDTIGLLGIGMCWIVVRCLRGSSRDAI